MTTLRILLPESWPDEPLADWALLGTDGNLLDQGYSEPRTWPDAARIEACLLGAQVSWHSVRLPPAGQREQLRALPFALEELLLREVDSQHVTPAEREDEQWGVLVISRERLRRITAQFTAINRPLDAVWASAQSLPWEPGVWTAAAHRTQLLLRTGPRTALVDDLSETAAPALVQALVAQAREQAELPEKVLIHAGGPIDVESWSGLFTLPVVEAGPWLWYRLPADAADLLHGEFEARHRRSAWRRRLRPVGLLLAGVFLAHLLLSVLSVWWQRAEINSLRDDMRQLLTRQLPGTPVLDPPGQLHRALNEARTRQGLLADSTALSLLADFSEAMGSDAKDAVRALSIEKNSLLLTLEVGRINPDTLRSRLAERGIQATAQSGSETIFRLNRMP